MNKFTVELSSENPLWWHFNVYMSIVCYDDNGEIIDYSNKTTEIYPIASISSNPSCPPEDFNPARIDTLQTPECSKIILYLYILTNSLPLSRQISHSPTIQATLKVSANDKLIKTQSLEIDQFGGYTIAGEEFSI